MNRNVTLKDRASYWFDGIMSRGMIAKIGILVLVSFIVVLITGVILAMMLGNVEETLPQGIWESLLYVLGKGGLGGAKGSHVYLAVLLLVTIYSLLFTAVLIGLITGGIRSKMDDLARGRGLIIAEGHTIILGYNNVTFALLNELIEANRNQRTTQTIVVLDEADKVEMEETIRKRVGTPSAIAPTKIICRSGSIYDFDDLRSCAIESSHAVIVNASSDFNTTKAIMACSYIMNESADDCSSFCVAAIHDAGNLPSARIAGNDEKEGDRIELVPMQDTIARIMVQASRQPGLSSVYTELFNFSNHEFYLVDKDPSFEVLRGMSIAEVNRHLCSSTAVGVYSKQFGVVMGDPREVVFQDGDALIVIEEDDDNMAFSANPLGEAPAVIPTTSPELPARILVIGAHEILTDVLEEYAYYLQPGSMVCVADTEIRIDQALLEARRNAFANCGIELRIKETNISKRHTIRDLIDDYQPDNVLVLCASDEVVLDEEDERIIKRLLYLQEHRKTTGRHFGITAEMNLEKNRKVASVASPDDFIVGRHFAALLMAQISCRKEMRQVFQSLLSHDGYEVYLKKASGYIEPGKPTDLFSLGIAVANHGEILIGLHRKVGRSYEEAVLNPPKFDWKKSAVVEYVFSEDDYLVVLSEDAASK